MDGIKRRIDWLDSLKGFAMLLVIIGHCLSGYISAGMFNSITHIIKYIYWLIYSFHMPLFFVLSGYAFSASLSYKKWKTRALEIFLIYWIWSIIQFLVKFGLGGNVNMPVHLTDLFALIYKPIPPYWYLYDLVVFVVVAAFVIKRQFNSLCTCVVTFAISLISWYFVPNLGEISSCLYYFYFFYLGIHICESSLVGKFSRYHALFCLIALILAGCLHISNKNSFFEDYIWTTLFSMFLISLFSNLTYLKENVLLQKIGYYSLPIYVIHCFITAGIRIVFFKFGVSNIMLYIIPSIVLSVLIPIGIYKLCNKRRATSMLFRPKI